MLRREFIRGLSLLPMTGCLSRFVNSICPDNLCETMGDFDPNRWRYMQINFYGGPSRWVFDNPLKPNATDRFYSHPMIGTRFATPKEGSDELAKVIYETYHTNGYDMPVLWSNKLPSSQGVETVQASMLLNNCIIVRGCHMGIDGHPLNNRRLITPVHGKPSVNGLIADRSKALIPSVSIASSVDERAAGAFLSKTGANQTLIPSNERSYFDFLFGPFIDSSEQFESKDVQELLMRKALSEFDKSASGKNQKLRSDYKALMKKQVDILGERYSTRVAVYQNLIDRTIRSTQLAGVTDRTIPCLSESSLKKGVANLEMNVFFDRNFFHVSNDLRSVLQTAQINGLAQMFAMSEHLLIENLSDTILIHPYSLGNLSTHTNLPVDNTQRIFHSNAGESYFKIKNTKLARKQQFYSYGMDSHFIGTVPNLLYTTVYFSSLTACLIELTMQLRKKKAGQTTLYDRCLIHITSEFDREPRPDLAGSEHGWNGHVSSFFSGAIEKLHVLGNIQANSKAGESFFQDNKTWGYGAPIESLGNRPLVYGNIISSLSQVLGIPTPTPNDNAIFAYQNSKIKPLISRAVNVESS